MVEPVSLIGDEEPSSTEAPRAAESGHGRETRRKCQFIVICDNIDPYKLASCTPDASTTPQTTVGGHLRAGCGPVEEGTDGRRIGEKGVSRKPKNL